MGDSPARLVARFDGWTLWRTPLELFRGDQPVKLQEQPLQILEALLRQPGELVRRDAITAHLWPDRVVDFEAGLNTAVRKLRAALGDDAEAPKYVETVPRQGYRFIGPIEGRDPDPAMEAPQPSSPPGRPEIGALGPGAAAPRPVWRRAGLAFLGLVAAVAVAITFVATRPPAVSVTPGAALRPPIHRLAVLPFENLSPDPANAFFADGMHEELLSALGSGAPSLEVISRTTMMLYRARPKSVRALARELEATYVLEGSVRREASTVRVSLQLVDAVADRQIWSRSYQGTLVDAMTLQTQLAREVAKQLAIELPVARNAQLPPPRIPEAYDQWLKGVLASKRCSPEPLSSTTRTGRPMPIGRVFGSPGMRAALMAARGMSPTRAQTSCSRRSTPVARRTSWSAPPNWLFSWTTTSLAPSD
jgi:TolB-like protein/DNA-binding winged helix-turn-helix (wHTH) protein